MGCYECEACRERDGRPKRGRSTASYREKQTEDVHQSAVFALCTAARHTACKGESWERTGRPLKSERGRKEGVRRSGEKPRRLSIGPPRGNDQALSLTSAADGHQAPSTPQMPSPLLQHFSSLSTFSSVLPILLPRRLLV